MVLYELVCIAKHDLQPNNMRELVRTTARTILDRGGVIRDIRNWGREQLPQRMRRHQQYHTHGQYWLMYFDSNPPTVGELTRVLGLDPRVIRHTTIKLGNQLENIIHVKSDLVYGEVQELS